LEDGVTSGEQKHKNEDREMKRVSCKAQQKRRGKFEGDVFSAGGRNG